MNKKLLKAAMLLTISVAGVNAMDDVNHESLAFEALGVEKPLFNKDKINNILGDENSTARKIYNEIRLSDPKTWSQDRQQRYWGYTDQKGYNNLTSKEREIRNKIEGLMYKDPNAEQQKNNFGVFLKKTENTNPKTDTGNIKTLEQLKKEAEERKNNKIIDNNHVNLDNLNYQERKDLLLKTFNENDVEMMEIISSKWDGNPDDYFVDWPGLGNVGGGQQGWQKIINYMKDKKNGNTIQQNSQIVDNQHVDLGSLNYEELKKIALDSFNKGDIEIMTRISKLFEYEKHTPDDVSSNWPGLARPTHRKFYLKF
jgi:hypothetical protein